MLIPQSYPTIKKIVHIPYPSTLLKWAGRVWYYPLGYKVPTDNPTHLKFVIKKEKWFLYNI